MEVNGDHKLSFLGELSLLGEGKSHQNYNTSQEKTTTKNLNISDTMYNPNSIYWGYLKAFLSATRVALRFDRWDVIVKERLTRDLSTPFVSFVIVQKCHQHTLVKFRNDCMVLLSAFFIKCSHSLLAFWLEALVSKMKSILFIWSVAHSPVLDFIFWGIFSEGFCSSGPDWTCLGRKEQCCMKGKITEFDLSLNC